MVLSTNASAIPAKAYAGEMTMNINSLRNLESVARLFQLASLLNIANEPTHELINTVPVMRQTAVFNPFLFIMNVFWFILNRYKYTEYFVKIEFMLHF